MRHIDTFLLATIKRSLPALVAITVLAACSCSDTTALENTSWELESLNGNAVLLGTAITLEFSGDQISGSAGCNHYGGSYRAGADSLNVSDLFWTEMGCLEPEGILEQEQAYLTTLSAAARYQISDGKLEIRDETGTQVLVFAALGSKALEEEEMPTRTTPQLSLDCTLEMDETYPVGEAVNLRFAQSNRPPIVRAHLVHASGGHCRRHLPGHPGRREIALSRYACQARRPDSGGVYRYRARRGCVGGS